ncbi:MAG TPA: hypothetical protein QGI22_00840 [Candidatus Woesearchaeota archaeon]|jgi:V/A-type H+-transporting ATPase subunit E|nr:hypothetical protein [Candidatus Woesearchaeota archaeon]HJN56491.1 hypothetical protein [Candidatus Woesearchaeota archaeon]|tara:strand:- start:12847 stop:13395 length:549 start_codon:yes stop_codon:yes gene_type:complete
MGLEKIKEEILQKAAAGEKKILADAAIKAGEIKKKTAEKIKQLENDVEKKFDEEKTSLENKENSLANIESNKIIFETKKDIIENTYKEAFQKIKTMTKKEREQIIHALLEKAKKEIAVKVVYANDTDAALIGNSLEIKKAEIDGGIICETEDGRVRVNHTFSEIFETLKEKIMQKTSKISFG